MNPAALYLLENPGDADGVQIENPIEPRIIETLAGFGCSLEFAVSSFDPQFPTLAAGGVISAGGMDFDISQVRRTRNDSGVEIGFVCDHVSYRLNAETFAALESHTGTPGALLAAVLDGTEIESAGAPDGAAETVDFTAGMTRRAALLLVADACGLEVFYARDAVGLTERRGLPLAPGHFVALSGVNVVSLEHEDDPREAGASPPAIRCNVAELSVLIDAPGLSVALGDSVSVTDSDAGIDELDLRVIRYERNPVSPMESVVEIGRPVPSLSDLLADIVQTGRTIGARVDALETGAAPAPAGWNRTENEYDPELWDVTLSPRRVWFMGDGDTRKQGIIEGGTFSAPIGTETIWAKVSQTDFSGVLVSATEWPDAAGFWFIPILTYYGANGNAEVSEVMLYGDAYLWPVWADYQEPEPEP